MILFWVALKMYLTLCKAKVLWMRELLGRCVIGLLVLTVMAPATIAAVTGGASAAKAPATVPAEPYIAHGEMQNFTVRKTPQNMPEIRFQDGNGKDLSLADFEGRVVLLNLWATWCAPCRREMPDIAALQSTYGGKDFIVVALSQDRKGIAAVRDFYAEIGVKDLEIFIDQKAKTARKLRAPGLPTTLLLNKQGQELGRLIGPANWNSQDARQLIEHYLRD